MSTPSDPESGYEPPERVDLSKDGAGSGGHGSTGADADAEAVAAAQTPFDPYRYGKPDHPIPAEFAPPGYTGPVIPAVSGSAYGPSPYGSPGTANPFANPPGVPYPPYSPGTTPPNQPPYGYPPYGYGAPPPPPHHSYVQPRTGNGKAIAALVLGILSIVLCWLTIFDVVFVVLATIFGVLALSETKGKQGSGRGMAVAGLACTVVGALLATIISIKVFRAIDRCGGLSQASNSSFNQCVKDNF